MLSTVKSRPRIAFLLTQLGTVAARRFAERIDDLGITPADAGALRIIAFSPGISQRDLAERLGVGPSRIVALMDRLTAADLVVRRRSAADRRNHELALTEHGQQAMAALREVGMAHEQDVTAALTDAEVSELGALLTKLAAAAGLDPEVHPGYRSG